MSVVLFDSMSWLNTNAKEYIDDYLDCTGHTREEFSNEEQLLEAVEQWLADDVEWQWQDFKDQCKDEANNHCLVTGYFMSWRGPLERGLVCKDLRTAVEEIVMSGDSHPVFSIDDEGNLVLDETHHDAPCSGNHYEFRILTARGEKYYNSHSDDDRRTLCENLKLNGRSRKVNTKIFGF